MAIATEECNIFAIAPVEMARDHRLTAAQYRVLLALLSYRSKVGNVVWPSRSQLAERTGYTERSISKYTAQLEALGWLKKEGKGGFGKSARYTIVVPDLDSLEEEKTLSNPETVSKVETVSNQDRVSNPETLSNPDTKTLSNLDRGKEQTIEQTNKALPDGSACKRARKSTSAKSKKLITENLPISPQLADELIAYRKQLRKPLTQRALEALAKSVSDTAEACGIPHEQVLEEMQLAGWQSVKPEWVKRRMQRDGRHAQRADKHSGFDSRDYSKGATQEEPWWVQGAGA